MNHIDSLHRASGHLFAHRRRRALRLALVVVAALTLAAPAVRADHDDDDRPTAGFTFSPTAPVTGESISFTSTSRDTEGNIVSTNWDLDHDGSYDDGSGTTVTRTFPTAGSKIVRIRVVDDEGESRTASKTVTVVANGAPSAVFSADPATVDTGQSVTLTSSSTDPDGRPLTHDWDTNNDGVYGDASGLETTVSFPDGGTFRVGLRVTDSGGLTSTTFGDIVVRNRPPAPAPPSDGTVAGSSPQGTTPTATARVAPRLMSPFPRVRINGAASASSVRVDFVNVRTSSGTRIVIRCKGSGCPYSRAVQTQRWTGGRVRTVRIKGFKRRTLRAGAVLEIYVIKRGVIGKYTRFRFRRLKPPVRVDRCTAVGKARAQRCPSV